MIKKIIIAILLVSLCVSGFYIYRGYNYSRQNYQLYQVATEANKEMATRMGGEIDSCKNELSNTQVELRNTQTSLNTCKTQKTSLESQNRRLSSELNKLKGSFDYYYANKIIIDETIKRTVGSVIQDFKDMPYCDGYKTVQDCHYTILGDYVCTEHQECVPNKDKDIYFNTEYDGWKEKYNTEATLAIYSFVRDEVTYSLGGSSLGTGAGTSVEILRTRTGKCDEMSILLVAMLRSAGIEANLVHLPKENHILVGVKGVPVGGRTTNTGYLLIDPTCKSCSINRVPDWDFDDIKTLKYYQTEGGETSTV